MEKRVVKQLELSIVRVCTASGRIVGAGFLVAERRVLTCAHVVSQALGLADDSSEPLGTEVSLDFLIAPGRLLKGRVVFWQPPGADGGGDIANIELDGDLPPEAGPVPLIVSDNIRDHHFRACGFPRGYDDGVWASGVLRGRQATGWVQIEDVKEPGYRVKEGFSGGPVWDDELEGVIGMIVAAERLPAVKAAFMIPASALMQAQPDLRTRLDQDVLWYLYEVASRSKRLPTNWYPKDTGFDDMRIWVQLKPSVRQSPNTKNSSSLNWDQEVRESIFHGIILGGPGLGKTWLLKHEAGHITQEEIRKIEENQIETKQTVLPIFVRLPELACTQGEIEESVVALLQRDFMRDGNALSPEFYLLVSDSIKDGHCILLLDALDEVPLEIDFKRPEQNYRVELVERLRRFVKKYPKCRILLTSRIAGYVASPFSSAHDQQEMELLPFNMVQQEAFVKAWFASQPEVAIKLLQDIQNTPQIRGLCQIPLMLALLCKTYWHGNLVLPLRRVELYKRSLHGLLSGNWKEAPRHLDITYVDAKIELLEEIAFRMFTQGKELLSNRELRNMIEDVLGDLPSRHELLYKKPHELVRELSEDDGVIVKTGIGEDSFYLFLHYTFQEYFCTMRLMHLEQASWLDKLIENYEKDSRWQFIILLTAGLFDQPCILVKRVMPLNLLLAIECFSESECRDLVLGSDLIYRLINKEDIELVRKGGNILASVGTVFAIQALVATLTKRPRRVSKRPDMISPRYSGSDESPLGIFAEREEAYVKKVKVLIAEFLKASNSESSIHFLVDLIESITNINVKRIVTIMLGEIGKPEVLAPLIKLLSQDKEWLVRVYAAEALGKINNQDAIPALRNAGTNDKSKEVRIEAANALGNIVSPNAVRALWGILHANHSGIVTLEAAISLDKLGSSEAIPNWIESMRHHSRIILNAIRMAVGSVWIEDTPPAFVGAFKGRREIAIRVMTGILAPHKENPTSELIRMLSEHTDLDSRHAALLSLRDITNQHIEEALIQAMFTDKDSWIRREAASALGERRSHKTVDALIRALKTDKDNWVRAEAAKALGEIGDKSAIPALLDAMNISATNSDDVRCKAALSLGKMQDDSIVPNLARALILDANKTKRRWWSPKRRETLREVAAKALGLSQSINAIPSLLQTVIEDSNEDVRIAALQALESVGTESEIPIILSLCSNNAESSSIRRASLKTLAEIAFQCHISLEVRGEMLSKLRLMMRDSDKRLRETAFETFEILLSRAPL